jgi:hypothetical protein
MPRSFGEKSSFDIELIIISPCRISPKKIQNAANNNQHAKVICTSPDTSDIKLYIILKEPC